jgi:hypothetical protein
MANGDGEHGQGGVDLQTQVTNWPTPDANCHKGSTQPGQRVGQLDEAAEVLWQTPGTNLEGSGTSRGNERSGELLITGQACSLSSLLAQPTHAGETSSPSRRRLNPQFVTWLMGWPPLGESGFAFSETEWCHYRQRQQSSLSGMRWKEIGNDDASLFT